MSAPAVALLPWGNVWEDFLDMIGITLDEWCTEMSGGWLHGYSEALERYGIRTILIVWSREARRPHRREHAPTGATVWVLPTVRAHRAARRIAGSGGSGGRGASHLRRAASLVDGYTATPPQELARVLRQEGCGAMLVQEYEYPRFDVCVLLGRWLGVPVFATYQGGASPANHVEAWVRRRTVPAAARLFIGAQQQAAATMDRYRLAAAKVTVVPNPIDTQEWAPGDRRAARAELNLPPDVSVACWHGRVQVKRKGLDLLVRAWRQVFSERRGRDLRLLLCGSGTESAELKKRIATAGLRGVHWRDEYVTDRSIVRRQLAAADVFVFPSRHEGFAVAPMEAMACGRPVVACNASGVADLLGGGEQAGGLVVPHRDVRALATALGRLLDDRALAAQLGQAARRRMVETYSLEAVGATLASELHEAVPDRFPPPAFLPTASRCPSNIL